MHNMIKRFTSIPFGVVYNQPSISQTCRKVKDLILQGLRDEALELYKHQLHLHISTHTSILPSIIKACSLSQTQDAFGLQLHCHATKMGFSSELCISNSIISMYAKLHDIEGARAVFDEMPQRDCISWNSMLNCFAQNGYCVESLKIFKQMYECGFVPNPELIAGVLSVCIRCGCAKVGKAIHGLSIVDERVGNSVFLSTALVDLHWKCWDSGMAFRVFHEMEDKNEVSWTAMIVGYVESCDYKMALDCFRQMQVERIKPNKVTLTTILPACAELRTVKLGKDIHGYAFRHEFDSDIHLLSALIHLYSKSKDSLHLAKLVFKLSKKKDLVLWSSIIAGCSLYKDSADESVVFLNQMQREGVKPNSVTLLAVLTACTLVPSINLGCGIHGIVLKSGENSDLSIRNSLINMYSKCGCLKDSHQVFEEMSVTDCISWSALINAYGLHGCGEEALKLFSEMKDKGIQHDSVTLLALLSACNHGGLVEDGQKLFCEAIKDEKLSVNLEHYACYIDLLGRAGKLECAGEVLRTMPMKPSPRILSSLVSACKLHGKLEVAESLLSWYIESEPGNAANHTLLSLIYAEFGKWLSVEDVRKNMHSRRLKKNYGYSRLEC